MVFMLFLESIESVLKHCVTWKFSINNKILGHETCVWFSRVRFVMHPVLGQNNRNTYISTRYHLKRICYSDNIYLHRIPVTDNSKYIFVLQLPELGYVLTFVFIPTNLKLFYS